MLSTPASTRRLHGASMPGRRDRDVRLRAEQFSGQDVRREDLRQACEEWTVPESSKAGGAMTTTTCPTGHESSTPFCGQCGARMPWRTVLDEEHSGALRLRNAKRRTLGLSAIADGVAWFGDERDGDVAVYREHLAMAAEGRGQAVKAATDAILEVAKAERDKAVAEATAGLRRDLAGVEQMRKDAVQAQLKLEDQLAAKHASFVKVGSALIDARAELEEMRKAYAAARQQQADLRPAPTGQPADGPTIEPAPQLSDEERTPEVVRKPGPGSELVNEFRKDGASALQLNDDPGLPKMPRLENLVRSDCRGEGMYTSEKGAWIGRSMAIRAAQADAVAILADRQEPDPLTDAELVQMMEQYCLGPQVLQFGRAVAKAQRAKVRK